MNKLAGYLKPYWKAALLAPLLMLFQVVTELLQPKLMADIVDNGIARGDLGYIMRIGSIMIGVTLIGVLGGFGCVFFSSIAAQSFGTDLRSDLYKKVQTFSFTELDRLQTASLITRLTNDILQVQNVVLTMLRILVRAPLLSIGGLIMAVAINPGLAMILLATVPVLVLALAFIIHKGFPLFARVQKGLDRVNTVMRENLSGVRVVKAFVRSDYEIRRFGTVNDEFTDVSIQAIRIVSIIMPVMLLVLNFSILAVIWFGGGRVDTGNMQVGEVMAFINYMTQILFALMIVGFMLMMVSRAKVSADRIGEVLDMETKIRDRENASALSIKSGRIDFDNVSFRYEGAGGEPVLRHITFTAMPGETVAVLGATGSGKSTLVNLIPRFYEPSEGRVLIDGIDVRDIRLDTLRRGIGMVLQESMLSSGTVRENIRWGRDNASDKEVEEAAKAAQAHEFIIKLPEGYDTLIGQRGVNLSGGQKQRIAIARAIIKKPAILILDDSTSAVDVATESRIQEALKTLMENSTRIVIAQRISTVLEADKILVLEDGQIAASGAHRELMQSSEVYRDIYHSQLGTEVA
ncbi:MAG: multidrug ABC transporter ATP-binding protein [Firmicutes bacterium HGW-Firmicutes-14]|nr:MAG: multidrug ABC transporter ATP-binding protein [Firmicutes bacterium HGW-Firmicutes-14]